MGQFCELAKNKCLGTTPGRLRIVNEVRIWLRVITVADLANVGGTCIPHDRLGGSWRNCSTLNWPDQPHPSEKLFGIFRWFLRKTFCKKPKRQHRTSNMPLDEHLGRWIPCRRHSVYEYTRTSEWLYKTTVKDDFPITIRLGRHACKENVFVEENESDIPDPSHSYLMVTQDDIVFPATAYSMHRPPPPPPERENVMTENKDVLFTSKKWWDAPTRPWTPSKVPLCTHGSLQTLKKQEQ